MLNNARTKISVYMKLYTLDVVLAKTITSNFTQVQPIILLRSVVLFNHVNIWFSSWRVEFNLNEFKAK